MSMQKDLVVTLHPHRRVAHFRRGDAGADGDLYRVVAMKWNRYSCFA